jgi:hypothetical protein
MADQPNAPGSGQDSTGETQTAQSPEALLAQLSQQANEAAMFPASSRTQYFFAYDLLLDQATISRFVKGMLADKIVRLPHHRLVWPYFYLPRETGLPSLARTNLPGDEVWGMLYNTRSKDFIELERHLKVPNRYHRVGVRPQDRGGRIFSAFTYIITVQDDLPSKPSAHYRAELVSAATERGLPAAWVAQLNGLETLAEAARSGMF